MTQISAKLNHLRISPRKVRAVAELIKGLEVDEALAQLRYLTKRPAKPLLKLLDSAVSNAQHNSGLDKNYLYIKEIIINEGMKLKRYKPKGFSLMMPIQKKTSHVKIVLDELSGEKRKKKREVMAKRPKIEVPMPKASRIRDSEAIGKIKKETKVEEKKETKADQKPKMKKEIEKISDKKRFGGIKTLGRRLFRRKVV